MTTNSFIYSLVEQSLETHFHKNNYRGKGYTFRKNLPKFLGLYTPYLECGYIIRATMTSYVILIKLKNLSDKLAY